MEREGISLTYPSAPLLIRRFNPDEGELRSHLLDRSVAITLSSVAERMEVPIRIEAVESVLGFSPGSEQAGEEAVEAEEDPESAIVFAGQFIEEVKIAPSQIASGGMRLEARFAIAPHGTFEFSAKE